MRTVFGRLDVQLPLRFRLPQVICSQQLLSMQDGQIAGRTIQRGHLLGQLFHMVRRTLGCGRPQFRYDSLGRLVDHFDGGADLHGDHVVQQRSCWQSIVRRRAHLRRKEWNVVVKLVVSISKLYIYNWRLMGLLRHFHINRIQN